MSTPGGHAQVEHRQRDDEDGEDAEVAGVERADRGSREPHAAEVGERTERARPATRRARRRSGRGWRRAWSGPFPGEGGLEQVGAHAAQRGGGRAVRRGCTRSGARRSRRDEALRARRRTSDPAVSSAELELEVLADAARAAKRAGHGSPGIASQASTSSRGVTMRPPMRSTWSALPRMRDVAGTPARLQSSGSVGQPAHDVAGVVAEDRHALAVGVVRRDRRRSRARPAAAGLPGLEVDHLDVAHVEVVVQVSLLADAPADGQHLGHRERVVDARAERLRRGAGAAPGDSTSPPQSMRRSRKSSGADAACRRAALTSSAR